MLRRLRQPWTDQRAERMLGALAVVVLLVIALMLVFVAVRAWPAFQHNGLHWFGAQGDVDEEIGRMVNTGANPTAADYRFGAWPLIWATILTTGIAVVVGLAFSILAAIFIVEFSPRPLRRVLLPAVRLLAAVPSVVYGLVGILVLAQFVGDHLISDGRRKSVEYVIQLSGPGLLVSVVVLTVMITPIMIAIIVEALHAVPRSWREGSVALGVNRWRAMWTISVRVARPAIIAGAVLATARALGEAIMLSMAAGGKGFAPNPADGMTFFFEPLRPLAATIVENVESINAPAIRANVYAMSLVLLVSTLLLSFGAWMAKRSMRRYGVT